MSYAALLHRRDGYSEIFKVQTIKKKQSQEHSQTYNRDLSFLTRLLHRLLYKRTLVL